MNWCYIAMTLFHICDWSARNNKGHKFTRVLSPLRPIRFGLSVVKGERKKDRHRLFSDWSWRICHMPDRQGEWLSRFIPNPTQTPRSWLIDVKLKQYFSSTIIPRMSYLNHNVKRIFDIWVSNLWIYKILCIYGHPWFGSVEPRMFLKAPGETISTWILNPVRTREFIGH